MARNGKQEQGKEQESRSKGKETITASTQHPWNDTFHEHAHGGSPRILTAGGRTGSLAHPAGKIRRRVRAAAALLAKGLGLDVESLAVEGLAVDRHEALGVERLAGLHDGLYPALDVGVLPLPERAQAFETIFPRLFRISPSLVTPPTVFSLRPRNTSAFASMPRATFDTRLAFMAFVAFAGVALFEESFGRAMLRSGLGWLARERRRHARM
eukprot:CAMPEP_0204561452 /NCGR_PEP_ID=MMETSP0661-20131031/33192_1 /ASSEMBLY_ACC=CAM_ASM_000606 /TAXON_ID=109239 /ORGANISM="Alexandrium margalefi, Strain AMGDE01CS-322" /LENGTH=211 /DNA_ID=CAMNT_0051568863 /DNA_START=127 /DNA_END=763 /DNA_ORIENTATION=-